MKKIRFFVLGILLIVLATPGFSQFTFGPKVGVNLSNVFNQDNIKSNINVGFDAGIFLRIGDAFYFQPEVNYSFRSATFKDAITEIEDNFKLKTHNLDIPLLLGYKFINNPNFNFRLFIGPRLGVLIDNSLDSNTDFLGKVQIGGEAGIGIDFWRFTFDVKYDFSANKYNNVTNSSSWLMQNMFNVALGFKILKR